VRPSAFALACLLALVPGCVSPADRCDTDGRDVAHQWDVRHGTYDGRLPHVAPYPYGVSGNATPSGLALVVYVGPSGGDMRLSLRDVRMRGDDVWLRAVIQFSDGVGEESEPALHVWVNQTLEAPAYQVHLCTEEYGPPFDDEVYENRYPPVEIQVRSA
jgi:hypothetical protein